MAKDDYLELGDEEEVELFIEEEECGDEGIDEDFEDGLQSINQKIMDVIKIGKKGTIKISDHIEFFQ